MNKLLIVGTGLFSQLAREYFEELSDYEVSAFLCHQQYKESDSIYGLPLFPLEEITALFSPDEFYVFVAIGYGKMNKMRQSVYEEIKNKGYRFATFIFPQVKIWPSTKIGENVFIFENNTIQPYTSIGNNTIIWSGNHFGHHGSIGDHCFLTSHVVISGNCEVGNNVFIGVNATLKDGLKIADETLIGAGAVIMKDTKPKQVFVQSSTKLFRKNSEELGF